MNDVVWEIIQSRVPVDVRLEQAAGRVWLTHTNRNSCSMRLAQFPIKQQASNDKSWPLWWDISIESVQSVRDKNIGYRGLACTDTVLSILQGSQQPSSNKGAY
ncbi:Short-chain dehydrogenase/reductase fsr5 [Fusarium oxysporum f. sp. albedinis]|nr:Short-chain dehydrogenase/reductase fsr5 [Fusarium oxysporum f. sp. albedinis]